MAESLFQRLLRAVINNKSFKLVALLLALVSWYLIHANISHERLIKAVPLTIRAEEGWAVLDASLQNVNILFRGSLEDLRLLEQAPVRLEVDARKLLGGWRQVRLTTANVLAAGAARPVYFDPPNLTFTLDQKGEKRLTVEAEFQGSPIQDFEVTRITYEPAEVIVHGPQRLLAGIESVRTTPIDLEDRSRPFRKTHVALMLPSDTWLANGTASNITVDVTIAERATLRTFQDLPVRALLAPGDKSVVTLTPDQINLTLRGRSELLGAVKRENLYAYVDVADLKTNVEATLTVHVFAPVGLDVVAIEPANIKVRLHP